MRLDIVGTGSVALAVAATLYGIVAGAAGLRRGDGRLLASGRYAGVAGALALTAAVAVLQAGLLNDDFSLSFVARTSSRFSPAWVKVVTMWSALDGSILLWAWLLSGFNTAVSLLAPPSPLRSWASIVLNGVLLFFTGVIATVANPFRYVPVPPIDGPGPNPLLQNHWMMAVHPVLMYLGVVGLSVPFAYAMAALATGRSGTHWARETRTWTLLGWGLLTAAIVAGGWWSYEVLGWGGYWAWDPVENLILLPWLTATAFVHSVQVQERRRMLKAWNIVLIVLTFNLSILATFLIRSGVLSSVHSFGAGPIGPLFLGFFLLVTLVAFGLAAMRWDQLRDRNELDSPVSRETGFLLNNVLLVALAFAVLLGTLFPLIVEALSGAKVTVGSPYFNLLSFPLWSALLALMGIGPLLPWRHAHGGTLARNAAWLVAAATVSGFGAFLAGVHKPYPLLIVALAGYNLTSIAMLLLSPVRARARATRRSLLSVGRDYVLDQRRRVGSMVVHLGVVVVALAVAASGGYRVDTQLRLPFGQPMPFQGYELTATGPFVETTANRASEGAVVEVRKGGRKLATLRPRLNTFRNAQQVVSTPGVLYRPWEDIYLNLTRTGPDGQSVVVRAVRSPLITWIWIGGAILLFGTVYALTPGRRRAPQDSRGSGGQAS